MSRAYMLEHGQKKTSAGSAYPSARQGTSNPAAEALRRQREIFKREQQAAPVSTSIPQATPQNPQFKRYELKEKQMNRQDGAAKQAAPRWDIGSVAANATLDYLNQSGVSTKYTQNIAQAAPKQTAPKQSASGWNLKSVAADATLDYLNQNGVSTKYTQDIARTVPKQTAPKQPQTSQSAPAWNTEKTGYPTDRSLDGINAEIRRLEKEKSGNTQVWEGGVYMGIDQQRAAEYDRKIQEFQAQKEEQKKQKRKTVRAWRQVQDELDQVNAELHNSSMVLASLRGMT